MRFFIGCLTVAMGMLIFSLPVSADWRPFRQTYTIEIEVECIDAAIDIIRDINGYNLESSVTTGQSGRRTQRQADFIRRVDAEHFRQVQEMLRSLGDVISEVENAQFLGSQIMDTASRIVAINQEIDRLTTMMIASESLDVLIAIDSRLSQLAHERNSLFGRRNVLLSQAASPVITIRLIEAPEYRPLPEPEGFGGQIAYRFVRSWRGFLAAGGSLVVFIVRIFVPLIALGICASIVIFAIRIGWRKRTATVEVAQVPKEKEAES